MTPRLSIVALALATGLFAPLASTLSAQAASATPAAAPTATPAPAAGEASPLKLDGAETFVYREGAEPVRLYVVKPKGWAASDKRPVLVWFFGGGFVRGTPDKSIGWARAAAKLGLVGVAVDYRVRERFPNVPPAEVVADGRRGVRWLQDHATELGIDPTKIAVGGGSAGGGMALWTALSAVPPASSADESPLYKPAALILMCPVSDTTPETGYGASRFGDLAYKVSAAQQLDPQMPPVLLMHGDADTTVPYKQSVRLAELLTSTGNTVEFITVPGGEHSFASDTPEWREKSRSLMWEFLTKHGLVPDAAGK